MGSSILVVSKVAWVSGIFEVCLAWSASEMITGQLVGPQMVQNPGSATTHHYDLDISLNLNSRCSYSTYNTKDGGGGVCPLEATPLYVSINLIL